MAVSSVVTAAWATLTKCLGVAIIFTPIVLIICGTLLVFLVMKRKQDPSGPGDIDETRMIQEMYQDMGRMATRIEALETILLEKVRDEDKESGDGLS
ncbi:MAG: envelope stress response membrane protein PspB [Lentisphaerae bacterium]|jgi:phage shock protein B|nr:envelope stress response membrane protein PspB [Lentisphaerota bacterium]MBT4817209.1 envelope stress response membrane protein PspB [Lentisphaerota bacterium]MBT5608195.1 envelope stress response membrane protein PspB [Lentisphaerota bacterium]MBT7058916.1 envelope stress response membrane protein PspB [Lentisphaerota bacterium]MBT7842853.1 envelope stress response membrane protein PspB [Lentisphaerota bacterium]